MGTVTIHVYDEGRSIQQDFTCEIETLLKSMRYFKMYLKRVAPNQDVEISVHCDVAVFAWLLRYAKLKPGPDRPALGLGNCLPVLISSNFLQMDELVDECIGFIGKNFAKVTALPLDMSSLADELHTKLSKIVSEEQLENLWQRSEGGEKLEEDRQCLVLINRLYKNKVEQMLRTIHTTLVRCSQCNMLFSAVHRSQLSCPSAKVMVDYRGNIVAHHIPEARWRFQKYLLGLRKGGHSWREIYWHIWGHIHLLSCKSCNQTFPACELGHCTYHPKAAVFGGVKNAGTYPCCGQSAYKFDATDMARQGCSSKDHDVQIDLGNIAQERVRLLLTAYRHMIAIPWVAKFGSARTGYCDGEDEDEDNEYEEPEPVQERKPRPSRRPVASVRSGRLSSAAPQRAPSRSSQAAQPTSSARSKTTRVRQLTDDGDSDSSSGSGSDGGDHQSGNLDVDQNKGNSAAAYSAGSPTDSDGDDALSGDEGFKVLKPTGRDFSLDDGSDSEDEAPVVRRSFLASLGAGKYTTSIRQVTENGSSRIKPALQAALFQELIRQDDADRIQALTEHLVKCRTAPIPKAYREPQQRAKTAASTRPGGTSRPTSAQAARSGLKSAGRSSYAFR